MVKNEQNLHLKHPHGELAVDGVVKKFTIKKGVSINMAHKSKSDTLKDQRGNQRVHHTMGRRGNKAIDVIRPEQFGMPLEIVLMMHKYERALRVIIEMDDRDDDKEVTSYDSK